MEKKLELLIIEELKSLDEEIRGNLFDVYHEPTTGTIRLEDAGMAYQGDDDEAYQVAQVEDGAILK